MRHLYKMLAVLTLSLSTLGLSSIAEAHDRYRGGYYTYPGEKYYGHAYRTYAYGHKYKHRYGRDHGYYPHKSKHKRKHHHKRQRHDRGYGKHHNDRHGRRHHGGHDRKASHAARGKGQRF